MHMTTNKRIALIAAVVATVAGCSSDIDDLQSRIQEVKSRPGGRIEPLPEVKPFEVFVYTADADGLVDPFKPRKIEGPKQASGGGLQPDLKRVREPLEAYPLENLKMVGTLSQQKQVFALIKTPDSNLFRVKQGNYLGQNFGLITEINEGSVKLKEIVQDSAGDWTERVSTLQLQDEQEVAKK